MPDELHDLRRTLFSSIRFAVCFLLVASPLLAATKGGPSRASEKGCKWEMLADANVGLEVWVERCGGSPKTELFFKGKSLYMRYGDGKPEPLIDVIDLLPGETPQAGLERFFAGHTKKDLARRCVLAPYTNSTPRTGAKRYTFVPNAAYQKELDKTAVAGDIPDPPCGTWGINFESVEYFEVQPASGVQKVLFVRTGQDTPPFDEQTLRLVREKP